MSPSRFPLLTLHLTLETESPSPSSSSSPSPLPHTLKKLLVLWKASLWKWMVSDCSACRSGQATNLVLNSSYLHTRYNLPHPLHLSTRCHAPLPLVFSSRLSTTRATNCEHVVPSSTSTRTGTELRKLFPPQHTLNCTSRISGPCVDQPHPLHASRVRRLI